MGNWGEGCGEGEIMFTIEALNIDPKLLAEAMEKLCGSEFSLVSATKLKVVMNASDFVFGAMRKGSSIEDWLVGGSLPPYGGLKVEATLESIANAILNVIGKS